MDDFCSYLQEWQVRNNVELTCWDSKKSKAYITSNKFLAENPNYIPESLSLYAYKAWVCINGKRGAQHPCRFIVRARFVPSRSKVVCKVLKHTGPGALDNGHNHRIRWSPVSTTSPHSAVTKKEAGGEDIDSILKRMRTDPAGAASLIDSWSTEKRRRVCSASFERVKSIISRTDLCTARQMVEALNVADLLAESIWRRGRTRQFQQAHDSSTSADLPAREHESISGASPGKHQGAVPLLQEEDEQSKMVGEDLSNQHDRCSVADNETADYDDGNTRSCLVGRAVNEEDVPMSRYADKEKLSKKVESVGSIADLIRFSAHISVLIERMEKLPPVADQDVRALALYQGQAMNSLKSEEVYFLIERKALSKLISRVSSYKAILEERMPKNGGFRKIHEDSQEVIDEDEGAERYGVKFQIFQKEGRRVIECSTMNLALQALLDMLVVHETRDLLRQTKEFLQWVSSVDCSLEVVSEMKRLEAAKEFLQREVPSLRAVNYQGGEFKSGFEYTLKALFSLRGQLGDCRGQWLTSDAVHIGILFLRRKLHKQLGSEVFILPPLQWDVDSTTANYDRESFKKLKSKSRSSAAQGEHFLRILENQKEKLLDADAENLGGAVIYTVVNRAGNHWLGLEACIRTRAVLVYDPADVLEARSGDGSEKYFTRLRSVLDCLLQRKEVPPPPLKYNEWTTEWTHGGQQSLLKDWVNCGVYAIEWINFRIQSAILHRRKREAEENANFLRERLRDTGMSAHDSQFMEKQRMVMAEFALREIKRIQAESTCKAEEEDAAEYRLLGAS